MRPIANVLLPHPRNLGIVRWTRGDLGQARVQWRQALDFYQQIGAQPMIAVARPTIEFLLSVNAPSL